MDTSTAPKPVALLRRSLGRRRMAGRQVVTHLHDVQVDEDQAV